MKIGIVSSGTESLGLFSFLNRYDHEYLIYLDSENAPYGDKNFSTALSKAKAGFARLKDQGADVIILPPLYELALLAEFSTSEQKEEKSLIFPLFQTYMQDYVFKYSLVGKLGIFVDAGELEVAQEMLAQLATSYQPTPAQLASKKFAFPFHFRKKET